MRSFLIKYGRFALAGLGILAVCLLVYKLGARKVLETMAQAGVWLPVIFALDLGWLAIESGAVLLLYGEESKKLRPVDWWRALFVHFATFIFVPVGRVSAEIARAGVLGSRVGKTRAAAGAAVMQSLTLTTNALLSVACLLALVSTTRDASAMTLMTLNIVATGTLGVGLYLVLRHVKLGGFLGRKFSKLSRFGPEIDAHVREGAGRHGVALLICVFARAVQALQYGIILYAVSGDFSISGALVAEGIQLAARSMGDPIPNQVGVTESAFALCAGAVGLAGLPEKAVAVALLGRLSNLTVAGFSALALQVLRPGESETPMQAEG